MNDILADLDRWKNQQLVVLYFHMVPTINPMLSPPFLNYTIVCFTQCSLFLQKICFLLHSCLQCITCGTCVTKINAVNIVTVRSRHLCHLACLCSHVLRAYCNFESKQAYLITLFGRHPNKKLHTCLVHRHPNIRSHSVLLSYRNKLLIKRFRKRTSQVK